MPPPNNATMNPYLHERLAAIRSTLMAQHAGGRSMPSATKGSEREFFITHFLQHVFPSHYRFTTGAITDSFGARSGQIDVAVENALLPSFPMAAGADRLLLAESVALVIEVKSNLSSQWSEVESTTKAVKQLRRRSTSVVTMGVMPQEHIPCFAVGYEGYETLDGLQKRLASTPDDSRPDGALVLASGLFSGSIVQAWGESALLVFCGLITHHTSGIVTTAGLESVLNYLHE